MSDYGQDVYNAIRSRFPNVDANSIIENAAREGLDFSFARMILQEQIGHVGFQMSRPSTIYRPAIYIDGNKWCALYGENLQDGVAGFGDSPDEAMAAFDKAWYAKLQPKPKRCPRCKEIINDPENDGDGCEDHFCAAKEASEDVTP